MVVYIAPTFRRDGVVAGFVLRRAYTVETSTVTRDGIGPDGEPVVEETEVETIVPSLTPVISKGVLFAQGTMYRPVAAPALPAMSANVRRNLYYNSIGGFYWATTAAAADDAFVGWARSNGSGVTVVSSRRLGFGPDETVPLPSGPVTLADTAAPAVTSPTAAIAVTPYDYIITGQFVAPTDTTHCPMVRVRVVDHATQVAVAQDKIVNAPYDAPQLYTFPPIARVAGVTPNYDVLFLSVNEDGRIGGTARVNNVAPSVPVEDSVTAADVPGDRWTDGGGTHTVIEFTPVIDDAVYPQPITAWTNRPGPVQDWRGWWMLTAPGQVLQIGAQGTPTEGTVFPPAGADEDWTVTFELGETPPESAPGAGAVTSAAFTVGRVGAPGAGLITGLTLTAGAGGSWPYNHYVNDSLAQDWLIPEISMDDSGAVGDAECAFFALTAQDYDASDNPIGDEKLYAVIAKSAAGAVLVWGALEGQYGDIGYGYYRSGDIAKVGLRVYALSRASEAGDAWTDPAASTLQTGVGTAGLLLVTVAAGGALPPGKVSALRLDPTTLGSGVKQNSSTKKLEINYGSGLEDDGSGKAALKYGAALADDGSGAVTVLTAGPMYKDLSNKLNLHYGSEFTLSGSDLTVDHLGIAKLTAGTATFLGTATFQYSTTGGKVQIGSTGLTMADNAGAPVHTLAMDSTGITLEHVATSHRVTITSAGVGLYGPVGSLTATSAGIVITNGTNSMTLSASALTVANVTISSGTLSMVSGSGTVSINTGTAGVAVVSGSDATFSSATAFGVGTSGGLSAFLQKDKVYGLTAGAATAWSLSASGLNVNGNSVVDSSGNFVGASVNTAGTVTCTGVLAGSNGVQCGGVNPLIGGTQYFGNNVTLTGALIDVTTQFVQVFDSLSSTFKTGYLLTAYTAATLHVRGGVITTL